MEKKLLALVMVFVMASSVSGRLVSADADGYSEGSNISTAFAGITLSSVGRYSGLDGFVYAYDDVLASTGTSVFGHNLSNHKEWYFDAYPEPHHPDDFGFRADFTQPANSVSIDMICNSSFAYAKLRAYDSSGVVLGGVASPAEPCLTYGEVFRATINRDSFDIAYIIAGGMYTNSATPVLLDNLTANIIPEPATTYYVNATEGSDNNDGLSPQTAFATIQKAINTAYDGDTVIVADGTYTGPGNRDINFLGKAITVRSESGPENCIIDCNGTEEEPHRGFYFHNNEDSNSILQGFTITNGYADYGGGVHCYQSGPTITNCIISGNSANRYGAGMHNNESEPTLTDCFFMGNTTPSDGGGMNNDYSKPRLANCTFSNNSAGWGGGMYNYYSSPTLTNCTFNGNLADWINGKGGGLSNYQSSPTVTKCRFSHNSARRGGAIYCRFGSLTIANCTVTENEGGFGGGGMYFKESDPIIRNCTITANKANLGGAVYCTRADNMTITNCTITDNMASTGFGGGIVCSDCGNATIINCTISRNKCTTYGGGIICSRDSSPSIVNCVIVANEAGLGGGAMYCNTGTPIVTNCTITSNSAQYGGGILCYVIGGPILTNCVMSGNTADLGDQVYLASYNETHFTEMTISYSNILGGTDGIYVEQGCTLNWGLGNIDADPCFVELGYWDANNLWVDGDYHLLPDSPCIDSGDNNSVPADIHDLDGDGNTTEPIPWDLDGNLRIVDGNDDGVAVVDMGAYEFFNTAPIADAGPNQVAYAWIDGIAEVVLDGNDSNDPDGDELTYLWSWTIGPTTYETNSVNPAIELPVGEHIIELIVNDGTEDSEPDEVTITVIEPMESHLWIFPRIIRRYSWFSRPSKILAWVRLPEGVTRDQIDSNEPLLLYPDVPEANGIEAIRQFVFQYRRRRSQRTSIFAFFDKDELMDAVGDDGRVELQVVGNLRTGQYFYGTDTVWITDWRRLRSLRHW